MSTIRSDLLTCDIELRRSIQRPGLSRGQRFWHRIGQQPLVRRQIRCRAPVRPEPLHTALAPKSRFAIAPKSTCGIELICAIDPYHTRFYLSRDIQREINILTPDTRSKAITGVIGQRNRLAVRSKCHRHQHRTKHLLTSQSVGRFDISKKCRWEKTTLRRQHHITLPAHPSFGLTHFHVSLDSLQLCRIDNGTHIDRLVERRTNS